MKKIAFIVLKIIFVIALLFAVKFIFNSPKDTRNITYKNATSDLIVADLPFPDAVTGKEFSVIGKARGYWFFEASFPVQVLDKNGNILATGVAQAQSDWMTENFVPFKADIKIPESYIGPATLILKKDNPSGLLENDASISFPITIEY
ncbi:MAG: Gmad2 immunoglobulin-like domain-containing protein [Candidatus Zambryskibacteria bacterium]